MLALIARVKNLLLSPGAEWDVIAAEVVAPRRLALRYVAPLSAIPAIAIVIALSVIGVEAAGEVYRAPILGVLLSAALFFFLSIGGVYAFAAIINWLAPRFGGENSYRQAFKVSAYSITAAMVTGIIAISPSLQIFALLGATYSLYLLFVGAPKVMKTPPASAVNYSIVVTFAAILVALGVGMAAMFAAAPGGNPFPQLPRIPFLEPDSEALQQPPTPQLDSGILAPGGLVATGDLRSVAPMEMAGLPRVAANLERSGQTGQRTVRLEAEYQSGDRRLTLQIVYSPSIAQVIGFGGMSTSEFDRETADGYSRRRRVGDSIVVEDWNQAAQAGSYGRLAEDRFYVRASGRGVSSAELRAAVELFGQETLAQFAAES